MSRLPSPTASPSRRETLLSVLSWKRWRRNLKARRLARQERRWRLRQERAAALLNPLWEQQLRPLYRELLLLTEAAQTLQRQQAELDSRTLAVSPQLQEQKELLLEILSSLQPSPQVEIARQLGLPLSSPSSPSSTS